MSVDRSQFLTTAAADEKRPAVAVPVLHDEKGSTKPNDTTALERQLAEKLTEFKALKYEIQRSNVQYSEVGRLLTGPTQKAHYDSLKPKAKTVASEIEKLMDSIAKMRILNAINAGIDAQKAISDEITKLNAEAAGIQFGKPLTRWDISDEVFPNYTNFYANAFDAMRMVYQSGHHRDAVASVRDFYAKTIIYLPPAGLLALRGEPELQDESIDRDLFKEIEVAIIKKETLKRDPDYDVKKFKYSCINEMKQILAGMLSNIAAINERCTQLQNVGERVKYLNSFESSNSEIMRAFVGNLKASLMPDLAKFQCVELIKGKLKECLGAINPYVCKNVAGVWVPKEKSFRTNNTLWEIAQAVYKKLTLCLQQLAINSTPDSHLAEINKFISVFEEQKHVLNLFLTAGGKSATLSPIIRIQMNALLIEIQSAIVTLERHLKASMLAAALSPVAAAAAPAVAPMHAVRVAGGSPLYSQGGAVVGVESPVKGDSAAAALRK